MPGQGRYTKYAIPADAASAAKNTLLQKMYGKNTPENKLPPQMVHDPGKEDEVRAAVVAAGVALLQSPNQEGDADHYPNGVDMTYGTAPDIATVSWTRPGDAANPYVADITSPGPGSTNGVDKNVDPQIVPSDIKPNFEITDNTQSPSTTSAGLTSATIIGNTLKKGKSI
jgi:hypothetical protein